MSVKSDVEKSDEASNRKMSVKSDVEKSDEASNRRMSVRNRRSTIFLSRVDELISLIFTYTVI
ncbi:hypothetical protein D3C74_503800 [compost metagenome]